jgi:ubiquitin C-terminal hydrolase
MKYIQKTISVDYIIQVNISVDKDNIIIFNDIQVFINNEFNETNVSLTKINTSINETYLKYPHFQFLRNNKSSESSSNRILSCGERELLSKTDKDTISILSNTQYSFKVNMSSSAFNLDSYKKISLAPLGLKNPSVYCYMNCVLQILLSIPELNYYFLYKKYKQEQNHKTLISDDYSNFISLYQYFLNHKENKMDLPPSMLDICNSLLPMGIMNDCEEFLMLLLKSIQEELNHNYNNKSGNIDNINDKDIQKKWCLYREANSSFTDSIFTGFICSTVICNKCNNYSYNYEPFMELSVPIPTVDKSIKKCLNIYFEVETIDCNYHCENCNNNTSVSIINI